MNIKAKYIVFLLTCFMCTCNALAAINASQDAKDLPYGNKGFIFQHESGDYLMHIEFRGQFRLAYPTDVDPILNTDYQKESVHLNIRRARLKVGGHTYKTWLKYYLEYELQSTSLLDFRLMYEKNKALKIKVGQWKVQYNRERIISSGKQQTMERSILTRAFTVDRQQGLSIFGHLEGQGAANFNYWASVFMGTGRGATENDDEHLMYMGRLQWNPNGKVLAFSGSDIEYHETLVMLLAIGGVTNRSPYTRFSQGGGGQLEGFEDGVSGQYRINQMMQESAGKIKGFSWQQELHYKQINDKLNKHRTEMMGHLFQAGYAFKCKEASKDKLEVYGRQAFYYPTIKDKSQYRSEWSLGMNYFIVGHRLKTTGELSHINSQFESDELLSGWRYRLQLDISF